MSIVIIILITFALTLVPMVYGQEDKNTPVTTLKNDTIMRTSATILGFTGLSFILGAKLSDHEDVLWQAICITVAYSLVAIEIGLHLFVILWAQKNELFEKTFEDVIVITVGLVVAILVCFALIIWLDARTKQKKHILQRQIHSTVRNRGGIINN